MRPEPLEFYMEATICIFISIGVLMLWDNVRDSIARHRRIRQALRYQRAENYKR
jgi:hypothetical protein